MVNSKRVATTALAAMAVWAVLLSGCATRQDVTLARAHPTEQVRTIAQIPEDGNSTAMDANLSAALTAQGLQTQAPLPAGTRTSDKVDALVSYVDVWRWDLVMYLRQLNVKMFDAKSGDLLVSGQWNDSALHGFRDAKQVVNDLVSEMVTKLRAATTTP